MIYITGDTHGIATRFMPQTDMNPEGWPNEEKLTADDVVIVCGDFGFVWIDREKDGKILDELEKKPYTICFCDGNHENFPEIFSYPEQTWNGGRIHRIRKNIIHLMRGQVFEICGKSVFAMGGAYSTDRAIRVRDRSYWEQELPSGEEYAQATANLAAHGNAVDIIVSHNGPERALYMMGKQPDFRDRELTGFLDWLSTTVKFDSWYFGHWHIDQKLGDRFYAVSTCVIPIS